MLVASPEQLNGESAENYRMLEACGCPVVREAPVEPGSTTIVVDALLGTGLNGPATGEMLAAIRRINSGFPGAKIVAVDIPSGLASDTGKRLGESVRADYTVTFTAPKVGQVPPLIRSSRLRIFPATFATSSWLSVLALLLITSTPVRKIVS